MIINKFQEQMKITKEKLESVALGLRLADANEGTNDVWELNKVLEESAALLEEMLKQNEWHYAAEYVPCFTEQFVLFKLKDSEEITPGFWSGEYYIDSCCSSKKYTPDMVEKWRMP